MVVEPIAGEGGFVVPEPGWLAGLAQWCRANGVVFVADEVQTGFGRTGAWFACEHEGVVPDIVTTAKGLGGGMPIAAVTGRAELMDAVHPGGLGSTFGGNPVSCAAALAAIDAIERDGLSERARRIGDGDARPAPGAWRRRTRRRRRPGPRGDGRDRARRRRRDHARQGGDGPAHLAACHAQGVIVLTAGTYGNVRAPAPAARDPRRPARRGARRPRVGTVVDARRASAPIGAVARRLSRRATS